MTDPHMTDPSLDNNEWDELLSAYFDDEVSAEQRSRVERALASSQELRTRLQEYSELRRALTAADEEIASPGLSRQVLRRLTAADDRRLETGTGLPARPARSAKVFQLRRWSLLAASLAVVCVVSVWSLRVQQPQDLAQIDAASGERRVADAEFFFTFGRGPASVQTAPENAVGDPRVVSEPLAVRPVEAGNRESLGTVEASDAENLVRRLAESGRTPTPGELYSLLATVDEQPVVISYSVLDVMEAFDDVQVLLQREGIHPLQPPGESMSESLQDEGGDRRNIVIYLEAPAEQVEQVLKEIPVVLEAPPLPESQPPAPPAEPVAQPAERPAGQGGASPAALGAPVNVLSRGTPATPQAAQAMKVEPDGSGSEAAARDAGFQIAVPVDSRAQAELSSNLARQVRANVPKVLRTELPGTTADGVSISPKPPAPARKAVLLILEAGRE